MKNSSNSQKKSILNKLKRKKQITKVLTKKKKKSVLPVNNIEKCCLQEVEYYNKIESDTGKIPRFKIEFL